MGNIRSAVCNVGNVQRKVWRRFLRDEDGTIAITGALSTLVLVITIGAAIDVTRMQSKKSEVQNLMDNAVLSAALALHSENGLTEDTEAPYYKTVGESVFKFDSRFDTSDIQSLEFTVSNDGTEVTGLVSLDHSLTFGGVLGKTNTSILAKSVVAVTPPESGGNAGTSGGSGCIILLEENDRGLLLNSGANINSPNCEVHVHANRNQTITVNSNVDLDVKKLCVAGSNYINNGGPLDNLETECDVMENPFEGAFPVPDLGCDYYNGNYNNSTLTLNPGVYCGWFNFNNSNANVTFNPGTYVLKNGGWNVNGGNWDAQGVSFYFADRSKIQFNSGVSANITAPSSGDYRGVAFLEKDGLGRSDLNLNDSRGFEVTGLLYLPSRDITFNSGSAITARNMSFISNRLTVNNGDLVLDATTILSEIGGEDAPAQSVAVAPYLTE